MKDKDFLEFIAARMVCELGENPNTDYITRLRTMADNMGSVDSLVQNADNPHPDAELIIRAALGHCGALGAHKNDPHGGTDMGDLVFGEVPAPRTFEESHWYPTRQIGGRRLMVQYLDGKFIHLPHGFVVERERLEWIGESLGDIKFGDDK